jgi:sugar phosphate isomerase/epimerase
VAKATVALQMYTLRKECEADYAGTLKQVARIGYPAVQVSPLHSYTAKFIKKVMDDLGLGSAGTHVSLDLLEKEFNAAVDKAKDLGTDWVALASIPHDRRQTQEDWGTLGKTLTEIAARLKAQGIHFAYHNHDFEFVKFAGRTGYDIMFDAADRSLVHNELDTYWVKRAGLDPVAYLKKYAGHLTLTHFKDMAAGPEMKMAPVGAGVLDWPAIIQASLDGGAEWLCVEQDECAPLEPLEAIRVSLENCKKWGLV